MKVGFKVKYGYNEIEIPITEKTVPKFQKTGKTDLFSQKVTIYNDITYESYGTSEEVIKKRHFEKFVIDKCNIQKGILENADGTIEKVVNAITITTKDIEHYKPFLEYVLLPTDKKEQYFTVKTNDFVVLAEVGDVVTTPQEFQDLQKKYKNNGFSVTAVNEYIHGMAVDNVQIIHA